MREAGGRFCLLLNEDSELRPGAAAALVEALEADPEAAAAGAQLLDSAGEPVPCAWRFPSLGTALAGALFLHRWLTVQSGGGRTRRVDWAQSSALLVRREAAAAIGYMDARFFVYYDECDFCRRLADAGHPTLYVPTAEAVHHDQLSTDLAAGLPRIVEFHRNRDLYMRKHHSRADGARGPPPHLLGLRRARPRRDGHSRPARGGLPSPCPPGPLPGPRREHPGQSRVTRRRRSQGRESSSIRIAS